METKQFDNLYVFAARVEPMELADGTWRWVVTDFAYEPDIYDDEGTPLAEELFSFQGDSKEELLNPFNDQDKYGELGK